jgi:hypothetical protein
MEELDRPIGHNDPQTASMITVLLKAEPGRSPDWLKFKNPEAPAVKGVAEKDCSEPGASCSEKAPSENKIFQI